MEEPRKAQSGAKKQEYELFAAHLVNEPLMLSIANEVHNQTKHSYRWNMLC